MILGLNQLHMGAPEALIPGNCRKSRPGPNGTSPRASTNGSQKSSTPIDPGTSKNVVFFRVAGLFGHTFGTQTTSLPGCQVDQ